MPGFPAWSAFTRAHVGHPDALDRAFHALPDAPRRGTAYRLSLDLTSVSLLARPTGMTPAAIRQHIRVLDARRLVRSEWHGRTRECQLSAEAVARVEGPAFEARADQPPMTPGQDAT